MKIFIFLAAVGLAVGTPTDPAVCANCAFNTAGIGYLPNINNCHEYIMCQKLADGSYLSFDMPCPGELSWRQDLLTCDFDSDGLYPCLNTGCTEVVYTQCQTTTPAAILCDLTAVPGKPSKFYQTSNGIQYESSCSSGTIFSEENCGCILGGTVTPCDNDPMLKFPFVEHYNDVQCPKAVGTPWGHPNITDGALCVYGGDKIEIWYLKNWFAENPTAAFTISLWFKQFAGSSDDLQGLFGNGDCNGESTLMLSVEELVANGKIVTASNSGVFAHSDTDASTRTYTQGVWTQVAIVYTGWSVEYWLNGVKTGTRSPVSGSISNTQVNSNIGMAYVSCVESFFTGCIRDFRVYNRVVYEWEMQTSIYGA